MIKNMTCIICPMGCNLVVDIEDKNVISVSGNTCKRGEIYAINECTNPQRTLTSTVRCKNGEMLPVKTKGTVPKDKIFECMELINNVIVELPINVGDVIIEDIFGTEIIATKNME